MFTVKKTLSKTVEYKFNSLKELHDWAANNRYNKARSVEVTLNNELYLNVRSIYEVFSFTLNKFSENNYSWDNL